MKVFNYINVRIEKYTKLKVDGVKVNWDDNTYKLIHKECHPESDRTDIKVPDDTKYHITCSSCERGSPDK